MSYQTVVAGLHERFATISSIAAILDYEPTSIQQTPLLYTQLDTFERSQSGQITAMRYRILHRLCFLYQDNERAEQELMAYVNAIPASVDQDQTLGGRIPMGLARISNGQAVFVKIGGVLYRAIDFTSDVLEKAPVGSGI